MSGCVLKPAGEAVTWVTDWRRAHLAPGERVLRDLGWTIQPDPRPGEGLRVASQDHDGRRSWAAFEGGAPGAVYHVTHRVRTSDDRTLSRAIVLRVAPGLPPRDERPGGGRRQGTGRRPATGDRSAARDEQPGGGPR